MNTGFSGGRPDCLEFPSFSEFSRLLWSTQSKALVSYPLDSFPATCLLSLSLPSKYVCGLLILSWEKAMAPHSSTVARKIPWMEEPGGLQSMGSLRVRHNWVTSFSLSTFMHWRRKWQPTPVFLPGESRGQRSLVGCSPWGRTESDTTEVMWQQLVSRFSIHSLKIILFIYLVLPVLGLHCCVDIFSSWGAQSSHCRGFFCCGTPSLVLWASVITLPGSRTQAQ